MLYSYILVFLTEKLKVMLAIIMGDGVAELTHIASGKSQEQESAFSLKDNYFNNL